MYYLGSDKDLRETVTHRVYRYFGGDSTMEGAYVTDRVYGSPVAAKSALALSDVDFDGSNSAEMLAVGEIHTTDADGIISLGEAEATGNQLCFSDVQPSTDYPGGGSEYRLEGPFDDIVDIVDVKGYDEDYGWYSINDYVDDKEMNGIDALIDDEIYYTQRSDVEDDFSDIFDLDDPEGRDARSFDDVWMTDMVSSDEQALDNLINDEMYDVMTDEEDMEDDFSDIRADENTYY